MKVDKNSLDTSDILLAVVGFIAALGLYYRTLTPGLLPGDSGEFQTLAYLLGHTHPTGYPVYLVLAKIVTFLPIRDVAFRVNLFSAIMASLTVVGVYLSGRMIVKYRIIALMGSFALAISPTFWSQAVIAEVYTSGAVFLVFILFFLLYWDSTRRPEMLFIAGFLGGLSLGIHMSVILLAPAVLIFLLVDRRQNQKNWTYAISGALAGVLITIMLFGLMDVHNPSANYFSSVVEPSRSAWNLSPDKIDGSFERLIFGWSARQFRMYMFADIASVMPVQAVEYWRNLSHEFSYLTIWTAAVGAAVLVFHRARAGYLLILGLVFQLIFMFNYGIWDQYVFYIPSYVILVVLSIAGLSSIAELVEVSMSRIKLGFDKRFGPIGLEGSFLLILAFFSISPIFQPHLEAVIEGRNPFDFDGYPIYDEFTLNVSRAMVIALPENAIVFSDWDMIWPYYYAAQIIESRSDLTFVETYPADNVDGLADSVVIYISDKMKTHPIFFCDREADLLAAGFKFAPARSGPVRLVRILEDE